MSWTPDQGGLDLLETKGSPFGVRAFRDVFVSTMGGWHDVSFGARSDDGTTAAIALIEHAGHAESVPPSGYGGIVASRPLDDDESSSFLNLARSVTGARTLRVRSLDWPSKAGPGDSFAVASVVVMEEETPPSRRYARLARRSIKRGTEAGATVQSASSPEAFFRLYREASRTWKLRYPEALIGGLMDRGVARIHEVHLNGGVVSTLVTLARGGHWMCWLASQTAEGRAVAGSYLAYDAVFTDAYDSCIPAVNLGASVAGGLEFKRHLGATEIAMTKWHGGTVPGMLSLAVRTTTGRISQLARRGFKTQ